LAGSAIGRSGGQPGSPAPSTSAARQGRAGPARRSDCAQTDQAAGPRCDQAAVPAAAGRRRRGSSRSGRGSSRNPQGLQRSRCRPVQAAADDLARRLVGRESGAVRHSLSNEICVVVRPRLSQVDDGHNQVVRKSPRSSPSWSRFAPATMLGMNDQRKQVWPWIAALLLGMPVLYVASFGPACWWFSPQVAPQFYWPIGWLAANDPRWSTYPRIGTGPTDSRCEGHSWPTENDARLTALLQTSRRDQTA